MRRRTICLVDGEHHPPVTRWALAELEGRGHEVVALVFLGGTEKIEGGAAGLGECLGGRAVYDGGSSKPPLGAIAEALDATGPEVVVDLSDAPVVSSRDRFRIASLVLSRGAAYEGADFAFAPPRRAELLDKPSLAIVGTGKRVGKTGVSVYLARLLREAGFDPVVVSMGRGGPSEPELVDPGARPLDAEALLEVARRGGHAASDYWEDAYLARVPTIGCRRCGGGMAGQPFVSNVVEGARMAARSPYGFVVLEGSGQALPPVRADASVLVVGAGQPSHEVLRYLGEYRLLLSDMVVVTMCEPPHVDPDRLAALERSLGELRPGTAVALTVFRPDPFDEVAGKRVFLATTSSPEALPAMAAFLEARHGCEVVGATASLADRGRLREALARGLPAADLLLTEIKAASIDVAVETASSRGVDVVFMNNRPVLVGGNVVDLDGELLRLCERCRDGRSTSLDPR